MTKIELKWPALAISGALWVAVSTAEIASAQSEVWLVTEVGPAEKDGPNAGLTAATALQDEGLEVIDPDRATVLFEQRHSKAPVVLEPTKLEQLQEVMTKVAHHLALEELALAQEALTAVKALTPEVADYLNREIERAEYMFQACLLMGHLMHKGGYRDDAYRQVAGCARDFPGMAPDQQHYPPYIQQLFRRAVAELDAATPVAVYIGVTSGEHCRARINGIDWGPVPTHVPGIRADEVRIQADCGDTAGRIYRKQLKNGRNRFLIDARFDARVRTESGLRLRYVTAADSDDNRVADNLRVATVVGASQILQINFYRRKLHWLDVAAGREVASVSFEPDDIPERTRELLAQQPSVPAGQQAQPAQAGPSPSAIDDMLAAEDRYSDSGMSQAQILGLVGAGLSAGAISAGWVYWAKRTSRANERLDAGDLGEYDGFRAHVLAFTGVGSAGLVASSAVALPQVSGVPWWSWLIGTGGLGLATYGVYLWAQDATTCEDPDCADFTRVDTLGGPFFFMQSLPLLAVPAIYGIRHLTGGHSSELSAVTRLHVSGGSFALSGRF